MCTVPVKLSFKDKNTRFQAELALNKACKAKCDTPYPKELRVLMDKLVKECKPENHGSFILARVDVDKLTITARARNDDGWTDLDKSIPIPTDLLDSAELETASSDEAIDMVTLS